jgi:hypothetical protein
MKSGTKDALSALDVNDFWRYGISGTIRKFSIGV